MKRIYALVSLPIAALIIALAQPLNAQTFALATDRPGTTFNTIGAGVATVINNHSDIKVIVRPYAGPAAWAPIVNSGEVMLGVMSANSSYRAFSGNNQQKSAYRDLRLVRTGGASLMLGFAVRRDGPIKSFSDLKGKRISSNFGGHLSIANSLAASLKIAGCTWDDVTAVPVTGANDGLKALVADRLDATWASLGQPQAREADTQIGIRYLSVPDSEEAQQIYQRLLFPGARIQNANSGAAPGIIGPTRLLSYDSYIVANKNAPDKVIRQLLNGLWNGVEELLPIHPSLSKFTNEVSVTDAPVLPYHPAAIVFYREKGLWNTQAQQRQDRLMADADN